MADITPISGVRVADLEGLNASHDALGDAEKFSSSLADTDDRWVAVLALAEKKLNDGHATPEQISDWTKGITQLQEYIKEIEQRFS